jgi:EmrB/QacA subfamily drug resistance transporter
MSAPPVSPPTPKRAVIVAGLVLAMFMAAIEATIVSTAMPTIVGELGGLGSYAWIGSGYLLASTVSVPIYGKLADVHGRRAMLLVGICLFLLGSIACGLAGSFAFLLVARAVQGLGAGAIHPVTLTVVGDLFRIEERGLVQGIFGAVWAIAAIAGPLLGALLVHHWSWRAVFFVNLPIGAAALLVIAGSLHESRRATTPPIDWAGALVLTLAAVLLLNVGDSWLAGTVGVLLLLVLVAIERRAVDPVVPLGLFRQRTVAVGVVSFALLGAAMMAIIIFTPLYLQGVLGRGAAVAGSTVAPMLVGWPLAATVTGSLLARTGMAKPIVAGSLVGAVALLLFAAQISAGASVISLQIALFCYGAGLGAVSTALIVALQASVGIDQRGVVTGLGTFARSMGSALGVALLGCLMARRLDGAGGAQWSSLLSHAGQLGGPQATAAPQQLRAAVIPLFWWAAAAAVANLGAIAFWPRPRAATGTVTA